MRSKLGAFYARGAVSDLKDIEFLVDHMGEKIFVIRDQFDYNQRRHFVNAISRRYEATGETELIKGIKFKLGVV